MKAEREKVEYVITMCSENVNKIQLFKKKKREWEGYKHKKKFNVFSYHIGGGISDIILILLCM